MLLTCYFWFVNFGGNVQCNDQLFVVESFCRSLVKDGRPFALDAETILLAVEKSKLGGDGKMEEKAVREKYKKSLKLSSEQIVSCLAVL